MAKTIHGFEDFIQRLQADCEPFVPHVRELEQLYGDTYRHDAAFIMQRLEDFASYHDDELPVVLHRYEEHTLQLLAEYDEYRKTGRYRQQLEDEIEDVVDSEQFKKEYLVHPDPQHCPQSEPIRGVPPLQRNGQKVSQAWLSDSRIGGGNCLDALLASDYGRVCVYEKNELSLPWREILGLHDKIDLKTQTYHFDEPNRYDFVVMVELLKHVSNPSRYLDGAYAVLKEKGQAHLTFALRMPQVDHLSEFTSVEECQALIDAARLYICD